MRPKPPMIKKPKNFEEITPLNKKDNICVTKENATWEFNFELPSIRDSNLISFSIIFKLLFLFEKIRSKSTLKPEFDNKKNFLLSSDTFPAKKPVNGSLIWVDKIICKNLLKNLLKNILLAKLH